MIELLKEDVKILDNIINELCKSTLPYIDSEYLRNECVIGFNPENLSDRIEFERLASIIEEFNCAEINREFLSPFFIKKNGRTEQFKKQGGFKNEFEKLQKNLLRENKQDELLDLDVTLKKFENKIGRKIILAGFIITFLSFLITVLTLEFWQTDESKREQKNQVENPLLSRKVEKQKDSLN